MTSAGSDDDWRLTRQHDYLEGAALSLVEWTSSGRESDHDHCEFCWAKFGRNGGLSAGYATDDRRYWVCPTCFADFAASFGWMLR